ncbi:hypothetical protein NP570_25185, partial [Vibrio parahaemolyticus]|nr:hypothetical protein [Vibrio parahaemolyticus]
FLPRASRALLSWWLHTLYIALLPAFWFSLILVVLAMSFLIKCFYVYFFGFVVCLMLVITFFSLNRCNRLTEFSDGLYH